VIFLERELEGAKIELCLKPDFNMIDAFRMLDLGERGEITQSEMIDSLKHNL
jgi:Ca2+-binding EF-hand superfamily protein